MTHLHTQQAACGKSLGGGAEIPLEARRIL